MKFDLAVADHERRRPYARSEIGVRHDKPTAYILRFEILYTR